MGKLDGNNHSAFIVFLPCFVLVSCCVFILPGCVVWFHREQPQQQSSYAQQVPGQHKPAREQQVPHTRATSHTTAQAPGAADVRPTAATIGAANAGSQPAHSSSPSTEPAADGGSDLQPGIKVIIHGLMGDSKLNGVEGTCKWFQEDKGRWVVELPTGEQKALKPSNLIASAWVSDVGSTEH